MKAEIPTKVAAGIEWVKQFKEVEEWLREVAAEKTGSEGTTDLYSRELWKFCWWTQKTPSDLITEAGEHLREEMRGPLKKKTWAEKLTLKYFDFLTHETELDGITKTEKKKLARTTARTKYGIMRSFFDYNGVAFKGKCPSATSRSRIRLPTPEDLTKVWKAATIEEKLALGCLRSLAWRPEDVIAIDYHDVRDDLEKNLKRVYIERMGEKEDLWAANCLTQETTEILKINMEQRKQAGEQFTDETLIFPYTYDTLLNHVHHAGDRVGVKLMPKMFRKLFRTEFSPIIGRDAVQKMAGWKIPGAGKSYFLPPRSKTEETFEKIEPLLTFEPKTGESETEIKKKIAHDILKNLGLDPDGMIKREKAKQPKMTLEDEAEFLTKQVALYMQKEKAAGGLPYEQLAQESLARIMLGAIKRVEEKLKSS